MGEKYPKYPKISAEWVLVENPDIIIGRSHKGGYTSDDITELKEMYNAITGLFNGTEAIKNNEVFSLTLQSMVHLYILQAEEADQAKL